MKIFNEKIDTTTVAPRTDSKPRVPQSPRGSTPGKLFSLHKGFQSTKFSDIDTLEGLWISDIYKMSRFMRKPTFCICENKDADQLRGNPSTF